MSKSSRDIYLVIGGSGFLGRHIVEALVARGDDVSVFDIVQRYHDVPFYTGDLSEQGSVEQALQKSSATCIIHTASPPHGVKDDALYWRVNVDGTQAIVDAAVAQGVKKLVFTSSAGVVFNGNDIVNIDERLPYPEKPWDAYNESKAKAEELVLKANGRGGLLTVALRPAGIFGPGDRQAMAGFYDVYQRGQTHFQIGENNNLFDWTYVSNVVDAHLLAADKLVPVVEEATPEALQERQRQITDYPLPGVNATTGGQRVPTSEARPLGPYVEPPPNGEQIEAAFRAPYDVRNSNRPVRRSRFDPLSDNALAKAERNPLTVAGNVFFITNGEPVYFWDLPRMVWARLSELDGRTEPPRGIWKIPKDMGFVLATMAEWWGWVVGKEPAFTRFRVTFSCVCRWHNIERARRVLGYEPKVGVEEGVKRMIDWWHAEHGKSR